MFPLQRKHSGSWGDLSWTLDNDGLLTISGTGNMNYFDGYSDVNAWRPYAEDITEVVITNGVTSIGSEAFAWCRSLTRINIPDGVTSIGSSAFSSCSSMINITIPDSVTSIGNLAFGWCYNLNNVFILGDSISFGSSVFNSSDVTIYCYQNSSAASYAADNGIDVIYLENYDPSSDRSITFGIDAQTIPLSQSATLQPIIFPDYDHPSITWSSNNPDVAIVSDGVVTAVAAGTCTITASVDNASAQIAITVPERPMLSEWS